MKVLIACEESQRVTIEFRKLGIQAYSCDILPCSGGYRDYHFQMDVFEALKGGTLYTQSGIPMQIDKWDFAGFHPPCFSGDTYITTKNKQVKIRDIKEGDYVLTHKGRYKKVTSIMRRISKDYRVLKSSNNIQTITTDEHPYYVRERKNRREGEAKFVPCENLNRNHFTSSVICTEPQGQDVSQEMLYIMGRYVADGHLRKHRYTDEGFEEMVLSIGKAKINDFKVNVPSTTFKCYEERTAIKVKFYGRSFCDKFLQFGRGSENKNIPQWVVDLPIEQLKYFLKGYLSGDGHIQNDIISCTTVSGSLAISIGQILFKVYNRPYSISLSKGRNIKIEGREVKCKPLYTIKVKINSSKKQNFTEGNISYGRVLINEKVNEPIEVFNLSVEEDESYIANGVAVHNCTYLSTSGIHWNNRGRGWGNTYAALDFVKRLMDFGVEHWYLENPVSIISSRIRKPDQIIQPYYFGDDASKKTCLWLKKLPNLVPTEYIEPRIVNGKPRWSNQTDSGQNKLGPSETRAKQRSVTYQGIAKAIAYQWGNFLKEKYQ